MVVMLNLYFRTFIFILALHLLSVTVIPIAVCMEQFQDYCSICNSTIQELGPDQVYSTSCCHQIICKNDADHIEKSAQELYQNLQDPNWRAQYSASDDFTGWPEALEHAKCPFCRHYPLEVSKLKIETKECNICLEDKISNKFIKLLCDHSYCIECLQHIFELLLQEKNAVQFKCPQCAKKIEELDVRKIVNNDYKKLESYYDVLVQEWLNVQSSVKHCPTPDCSYRFINASQCPQNTKCPSCKHEYCSSCLLKHPSNITCETATTNDKANDEWKQKNSKPCPRCKTSIEKNGGCNYVTCTNCGLGFCYYCFGTHHGTVCPPTVHINQNPIDHEAWHPFDFERFIQENRLNERINQLPNNLRFQLEARIARRPRLNAQLLVFARRLRDNIALAEQRRNHAIVNQRGAYIQKVEPTNGAIRGTDNRFRRILISFNQNIDDRLYGNFVTFLNRLLHEHRPRPSAEVKKFLAAKRIQYTTTLKLETFQQLLNRVNQHFFN